MARVEGNDGRAHLRLVVWGPPCSLKPELLGRLHAACEAPARGGHVRLDEGSNAAGQVEYAFMDLPPWDGRTLRLHCLTAGDTPGLEDLRRRLLAETDAVLFVAHLGVEQRPLTVASWQELAGHLDALGGGAGAIPIAIVVDGEPVQGLEEGVGRLPQALGLATHRLPGEMLGVHAPDDALDAAQALVAAAVLRAFPREGDRARGRIAYEASLARRFAAQDEGDLQPPTLPWERSASPSTDAHPAEPEAGPHEATQTDATELMRWMKVRESDLAILERERALRRLLIEIGEVCAEAKDSATMVRGVLARLVMNLDATNAWLGFERGPRTSQIYDCRAAVEGATEIEALAARLLAESKPGESTVLDANALAALDAASEGMFHAFVVPPDGVAWILVTAGDRSGLAPDARALVGSAASFVGLAAARLDALEEMQRLNRDLEERVRQRTEALRRQKARLEDRVRARTRDLEAAKLAALASERRLLDAERREGVHRLAAGMAHEFNNPLAALSASLAYVGEVFDEWCPGHIVSDEELTDLREAVEDGLGDARRMERLVLSLFGSAARSRRAAVRTDLGAMLRRAARHAREAVAGTLDVRIEEEVTVFVGIPPSELTRWLFRLLTSLTVAPGQVLDIRLVPPPKGPALRISLASAPGPDAEAAMADVAQEAAEAGGGLEVETGEHGFVVELALPAGVGTASSTSAVQP